MKAKTINNRRKNRSKYKGSSRYAHKISLQKKGIFNTGSPFSLTNGEGISLDQLNKLRFKPEVYK